MSKSRQWFVLVVLHAAAAGLIADAFDAEGANVRAVQRLGITGQGVHIALLSHSNVRTSHSSFERPGGASAVTNHDFTGAGIGRSEHDTNMAGLLVAMPTVSHPDMKGIAFGARVESARIIGAGLTAADLTNALDTLITKHHCRVLVTGIQLPPDKILPNGNSLWSQIYDYYAEKYDVVFANAAGNESTQITVFGDCYNGITTGGLRQSGTGICDQAGRISNSGPTADGRKKPDLAAPSERLVAPSAAGDDLWTTVDPNGLGLTSFAAPFTAGTAALLLEAAGRNPAQNDDRSEVLKAVLLNSTTAGMKDKKGETTVSDGSPRRWQPDSGHGRINALKAYNVLTAGPIEPDQTSNRRMGWAYGVMQNNTEHSYLVQMKKDEQLVFTVTWHRKLNKVSNMFIEEPVRFSMDAKVLSPSGKMVVFETPGPNNVIKADLRANEEGTYKLVLRNPTQAKERDYGMAFEIWSP